MQEMCQKTKGKAIKRDRIFMNIAICINFIPGSMTWLGRFMLGKQMGQIHPELNS
jgi:hypothetical protein